MSALLIYHSNLIRKDVVVTLTWLRDVALRDKNLKLQKNIIVAAKNMKNNFGESGLCVQCVR